MDQWNYAKYQGVCPVGGKQSMGGTMTVSVAEKLVNDMIQVQIPSSE
jgi:hypothetical protein